MWKSNSVLVIKRKGFASFLLAVIRIAHLLGWIIPFLWWKKRISKGKGFVAQVTSNQILWFVVTWIGKRSETGPQSQDTLALHRSFPATCFPRLTQRYWQSVRRVMIYIAFPQTWYQNIRRQLQTAIPGTVLWRMGLSFVLTRILSSSHPIFLTKQKRSLFRMYISSMSMIWV